MQVVPGACHGWEFEWNAVVSQLVRQRDGVVDGDGRVIFGMCDKRGRVVGVNRVLKAVNAARDVQDTGDVKTADIQIHVGDTDKVRRVNHARVESQERASRTSGQHDSVGIDIEFIG